MKYLDKILVLIQLIPSILEAIEALQKFFPKEGAGFYRLSVLKQVFTVSGEALEDMWPQVELLVSKIVWLANKIGKFKTEEETDESQDQIVPQLTAADLEAWERENKAVDLKDI